MGRPREHDEQTAAALLAAAERVVTERGLPSLSVRHVAAAAGTTTRAVYSLFGSKEGLVVALGTRAFNLLKDGLDSLPVTDDPAADLVEAGVAVFRRFTVRHPALFTIGLLQTGVPAGLAAAFRSAQHDALGRLHGRIGRLESGGRLGGRNAAEAAVEFHALCEGLTAMEGRRILRPDEAPHRWRQALRALVTGWAATSAKTDRSRRMRR